MDDLTILNEIHKGVTMGMASLELISEKAQDQDLKDDLSFQYNEYQYRESIDTKLINQILLNKNTQLIAHPIRGKSGLITTLAGSDGYFCIPRDCEGLPGGAPVQVTLYSVD